MIFYNTINKNFMKVLDAIDGSGVYKISMTRMLNKLTKLRIQESLANKRRNALLLMKWSKILAVTMKHFNLFINYKL